MSQWDALVSAALVGTERRPVPATDLDELDELDGTSAAAANDADPAALLLDRAALLVARRRAGFQPAHRDLPAPSRPDDRPAVSRAAAHRLARILAGEHPGTLPEWLTAAAERGLRVPGHLLPALLDRARGNPRIRGLVSAVGGHRARWLAGLNPDWAYLLDQAHTADTIGTADGAELDPDVWEYGDPGGRRGYLAHLRARHPDRARDLLAGTWAQETPQDRIAFLTAFGADLIPGDEPFLETALDDPRREVRQIAADLLARIPGSALATRMARRATACLTPGPHAGRLLVDPPSSCDAGAQRDGVQLRPPDGVGERAWWLEELLARTPLATWIGRLGATPAQIVALDAGDWHQPVITGWARAAITQRDLTWARALLREGILAGRLLAVLPPEERAAHAAGIVTNAALGVELVELLTEIAGPWSEELAAAALTRIVQAGRQYTGLGERLCAVAALRLPPELHERAEDLVEHPWPALRRLATTLRFRHDMLRELR
ncbi:DUF5691 domain-containing protein [Actinopolymorpha pittospori]